MNFRLCGDREAQVWDRFAIALHAEQKRCELETRAGVLRVEPDRMGESLERLGKILLDAQFAGDQEIRFGEIALRALVLRDTELVEVSFRRLWLTEAHELVDHHRRCRRPWAIDPATGEVSCLGMEPCLARAQQCDVLRQLRGLDGPL